MRVSCHLVKVRSETCDWEDQWESRPAADSSLQIWRLAHKPALTPDTSSSLPWCSSAGEIPKLIPWYTLPWINYEVPQVEGVQVTTVFVWVAEPVASVDGGKWWWCLDSLSISRPGRKAKSFGGLFYYFHRGRLIIFSTKLTCRGWNS